MPGSVPTPTGLLAATVRVPAHVVYREFPAEVVLLNLNTGRYHGLNPTAGRMLRALEEQGSLALAVQTLASDLAVSRERVEADLVGFVLGLEERGLIEVERPA
jgi:DNA-binding MarR family transcriptional regulator